MEAKNKYYASVSLHLFAGLVFGYVAGYRAGQIPNLNPDHFKIPASPASIESQYVAPEAEACSKKSPMPCA